MILTIPMQHCRFTDDEHLRDFARKLVDDNKEIETVQFGFFGKYKVFFRSEFVEENKKRQ